MVTGVTLLSICISARMHEGGVPSSSKHTSPRPPHPPMYIYACVTPIFKVGRVSVWEKKMMSKLYVSSPCLTIPQLGPHHHTLNGRSFHATSSLSILSGSEFDSPRSCVTALALSSSTSQYQTPKRRVGGSQDRLSSFNRNGEFAAVPTSVPVRVARELQQAGYKFLDVRTPDEYSVGHAVGAVNVPYLFKVGSGTRRNPKFLEEVLSRFRKDDEILVGSDSGKRSLVAAAELMSAGFTGIIDIHGGFAVWSRIGLPTES